MSLSLNALNESWLAHMRAGRFADAWAASDAALSLRQEIDCTRWQRHEQFIWNGASLANQRVLVRCYHGLGDTIQFVRFIPALARIASSVTLWVQPALVPLLSSLAGVCEVMPLHDGVPEGDYDVDVELAELMHVFRVTPESLPTAPYLLPGEGRMRVVRKKARVGLVWSAGDWDAARSIPCERLGELGRVPGISWLLFQRGPALSQWRHPFGSIPCMTDIVSEAHSMRELDLLITVDTCSAHLAGALGIPVWTLLRKSADWRWMEARSDTPWYPTMRLFRQEQEGDWADVLRRVTRELRSLPGGQPVQRRWGSGFAPRLRGARWLPDNRAGFRRRHTSRQLARRAHDPASQPCIDERADMFVARAPCLPQRVQLVKQLARHPECAPGQCERGSRDFTWISRRDRCRRRTASLLDDSSGTAGTTARHPAGRTTHLRETRSCRADRRSPAHPEARARRLETAHRRARLREVAAVAMSARPTRAPAQARMSCLRGEMTRHTLSAPPLTRRSIRYSLTAFGRSPSPSSRLPTGGSSFEKASG